MFIAHVERTPQSWRSSKPWREPVSKRKAQPSFSKCSRFSYDQELWIFDFIRLRVSFEVHRKSAGYQMVSSESLTPWHSAQARFRNIIDAVETYRYFRSQFWGMFFSSNQSLKRFCLLEFSSHFVTTDMFLVAVPDASFRKIRSQVLNSSYRRERSLFLFIMTFSKVWLGLYSEGMPMQSSSNHGQQSPSCRQYWSQEHARCVPADPHLVTQEEQGDPDLAQISPPNCPASVCDWLTATSGGDAVFFTTAAAVPESINSLSFLNRLIFTYMYFFYSSVISLVLSEGPCATPECTH